MDRDDLLGEIRDLNLVYLMLAQRLLRDDLESGMFRLGLSKPLAERLVALSSAELLKMASVPMLVPSFRFDNEKVLSLMAGNGRDELASGIHASILAASLPVQELVEEKEP
jgi:flagellar transcriptional activator FlhD